MREWMIALGVLVVVAVLLDCVRRMRNASRDSLQLAIDMNRGLDRSAADPLDGNGEIGSVRVSHRHRDRDEPAMMDDESASLGDTGRRQAIDLGQTVPLLIDVNEQRIEPGFGSDHDEDPIDDMFGSAVDDEHEEGRQNEDLERTQPVTARQDRSAARPIVDSATTPLTPGESDVLGTPRVFERPADRPPPRREPPVIKQSKPVIKAQQERAMKQQAQEQQKPPQQQLALEEIIVMNVMARDRTRFSGAALLEALLSNGLRYGHRNIFHHYIGEDREDEVLYSVVNIVKPGTFDLNEMDSFNTPGISFFMRLPTPGPAAIQSFESMLAAARNIADQLNGELRDENRSVMTAQTIEHYRQRIRDFEMQSQLRSR